MVVRLVRFWTRRTGVGLDYLNGDLVGPGATFYLDRHDVSSFLFGYFCFAATRSFALRERGLKTNSSAVAVIGRLVRTRNSAS